MIRTLCFLALAIACASADNGVVKFRISGALFKKLAQSSANKNFSTINNGNIPSFEQTLPNGKVLGLTNARIANGATGEVKVDLRSSDQSVYTTVSFNDVKFSGTITVSPDTKTINAAAKLLKLSTRFSLKKSPSDRQYKFELTECEAKAEQLTGIDLSEYGVTWTPEHAINQVLCSPENKRLINEYANVGISSLGRVPIPTTDYSIDLSMVEPTAIHDNDIVITHSGTVYRGSQKVMGNDKALPELPPVAADEGLDIQLSQFAINAAAKLNFEQGLLQMSIPQTHKAASYLKRAFDVLKNAKPDHQVSLLLKAREAPKVKFVPTHIELHLPMTLVASAEKAGATSELLKTDITYDLKFPQLESMPAEGFGLEQLFTGIKIEKNVQVVSTAISDADKDTIIGTLDKLTQLGPNLYKGKAASLAGNLPKILLQDGSLTFHANLDMACFVGGTFGARVYMGPLCKGQSL